MTHESKTHEIANGTRWGDLEYLLADLIHVWTGKPHPARPGVNGAAKSKPAESSRRQRILADRRAKRLAAQRNR